MDVVNRTKPLLEQFATDFASAAPGDDAVRNIHSMIVSHIASPNLNCSEISFLEIHAPSSCGNHETSFLATTSKILLRVSVVSEHDDSVSKITEIAYHRILPSFSASQIMSADGV